ncbi:scale keratin-like [Gopherus evgoodei]|uniref:scale keratin-like n=1 Tax=Gopherus evgoodei TaxID=1825980 RepID=UPI0011CF5A68|nr:scale keratin-like [Gopherus evgoodei]
MSSSKALCYPRPPCYPDICPDPYVNAWNEPCITSCGDSSAVVYAPPVVVRFPGPILATCPQDSVVGSTLPNLLNGYGGPYGGGSFSGSVGSGGAYGGGYGGGYGAGYGSGYGGLYGYGKRYGRKCYSSRFGSCGPC